MPALNMRIKDYHYINAIIMAPIWHTTNLGMIRLLHSVIKKKNGIAHCFTTSPLPAKVESGLVATLKVKGYSLWIKHPLASCIEQRPRPLPFMAHTAQHSVLMRPLPARAGSGLL